MTTREQVIAAAENSGVHTYPQWLHGAKLPLLEKFYAIAFEAGRVAEREECAKVCERQTEGFAATSVWDEAALSCSKTIRARGDTK